MAFKFFFCIISIFVLIAIVLIMVSLIGVYRIEKAHRQATVCPKCGANLYYINLYLEFAVGKDKHYYICECRKCGCEWETDMW